MSQIHPEEEITGFVEIQSQAVIESLTRGEIDQQIRTAKAYPRSITNFRKYSTAMVQLDQETAEACIYSMPRAGKALTGPSVRFAEIILSAWGNARAGYRPIDEGERHVTAQGVFADLENNTAITAEVRRGIMGKNGRRFSDDMINVTMNAAGSIALRNAILRGIPQALWRPVYEAAKEVAIGNATTLVARRQKVVEFFGKMGVTTDRLLYRLERTGIDDINLNDLEILTGLKTAIKEGMSVDEAFPPVGSAVQSANGASKAEQLKDKLRAEREQQQEDQKKNERQEDQPAPSFDQLRSHLLAAFNALVETQTLKIAKATLKQAAGTEIPEAVPDEKLGDAIRALNERAQQSI